MSQTLKSASGVVGAFNNNDWYSFTITSSSSISLDLFADYGSPSLFLVDSSGNQISSGTVFTSISSYGALEEDANIVATLAPGTYYTTVSDTTDSAYNLALASAVLPVGTSGSDGAGNTSSAAHQLGTLGANAVIISDYVGPTDTDDFYGFQLAGPAVLRAGLSNLTGAAELILDDSAGHQIAIMNGKQGVNDVLNEDLQTLSVGNYYIDVKNQSTSGTGYNLNLSASALLNQAGNSSAAPLVIGSLSTTPVVFHDYAADFYSGAAVNSDWYSFTLAAPSFVQLNASGFPQSYSSGSSNIITITVFAPDGTTQVATASGSYQDQASLDVPLSPLAAGTYLVKVNATYGTENYTLSAAATPAIDIAGNGTATALLIPQLSPSPVTYSGIIDTAGYGGSVNPADVFQISVASATTLSLVLSDYGTSDLVGSSLNVALLNSAGTSLTHSEAGGSEDGVITQGLSAGIYYIDVSPYFSGDTNISNYSLSVAEGAVSVGSAMGDNAGSTPASALIVGALGTAPENFAGYFSYTDADDYYQFTLSQTSVAHFDVRGIASGVGANLDLRSTSNTLLSAGELGDEQPNSLDYILTPGTYYVDMNMPENASSGFNLQMYADPILDKAGSTIATARQAGTLTGTETFSDYVGPTDTDDKYQFIVPVASTVTLDLASGIVGTFSYTDSSLSILTGAGTQLATTNGNEYGPDTWLQRDLSAGTYYVDVSSSLADDYTLNIGATPISDVAGTTMASAASLGPVQVACFVAGTRIHSSRGLVEVQNLVVGDQVKTRQGGWSPIVWLGYRRIDLRTCRDPDQVQPVRIAAGSFEDGVPQIDLWLSPDHAIFVDGVLIPIKHLTNGATIVQEVRDSVTYWHVELDSHNVILAENLPCESYLDTGNRHAFVNGSVVAMLHADFSAKSWNGDACAPLVQSGMQLEAVKARLFMRAQASNECPNLALSVEADGITLVPGETATGSWKYRVPPGIRSLRLLSPAWVPAHCSTTSLDRRNLGVRIYQVWIDGHPIQLTKQNFFSGFYHVEQTAEGVCRWTNGDARLLLPKDAAVVVLRMDCEVTEPKIAA